MQKVEGSNPFSRFFANPLHVGGSLSAQVAETRSNHPRISPPFWALLRISAWNRWHARRLVPISRLALKSVSVQGSDLLLEDAADQPQGECPALALGKPLRMSGRGLGVVVVPHLIPAGTLANNDIDRAMEEPLALGRDEVLYMICTHPRLRAVWPDSDIREFDVLIARHAGASDIGWDPEPWAHVAVPEHAPRERGVGDQ
ncbi:MAG TPA: hypothetical protein VFM94_09225 [Solirubrobacterales bacterium]|nr:hypothetical protein [Solirubrobacterales bacterium]